MLKNAKKVLSVMLALALLVMAIPFGVFANEATETTAVNILENEDAYASFAYAPLAQRLLDGTATSGSIEDAHFELSPVVPTEVLTQTNAKKPTVNWSFFFQSYDPVANKEEHPSSVGLYEEDIMRDLVTESNQTIYHSRMGKPESNRFAYVFRLGGYYDVDTFKLTQYRPKYKTAIRKFTVYASDKLTDDIYNNPVGTGGSLTEDEIVVTLNDGANAVRYLVVVLDAVVKTDNTEVISTEVYPNIIGLQGFAAYGEKVAAPAENVLANTKAVAGEYRIELDNAVMDGDSFDTVMGKLNYDNLSAYSGGLSIVSGFDQTGDRDVFGVTSLADAGVTKDQAFDMLEDVSNTQPFRIQMNYSSGFKYRYAIGYDLGDEYTLDKFVLTQNRLSSGSDDRMVNRFSVYAGNALDATIFSNQVGVGGSATNSDITVDLEGAKNVRYLVIVFDQMSNSVDGTTNMYSYYANITNIAAYGEKRENLVAKDTTVGDIYTILLDDIYYNKVEAGLVAADKATEQDYNTYTTFKQDEPWSSMEPKLVYDNIHPSGMTAKSSYIFNGAAAQGFTSNDEVIKYIVATKNASNITINGDGGAFPNRARAALGFDLGANYDLEKLQLTQIAGDNDGGRHIFKYSVYASDVFNTSIFNEENKIGTGGGTADEIGTTFKEGAQGRYVVIVFDHVSVSGYAEKHHIYGYLPFGFSNIVLHGEANPVEERENILTKPEVIGDLYTTTLAVPFPDITDTNIGKVEDATVKGVYAETRYPYDNLVSSGASFNKKEGLATNDEIIDQLILADKNVIGTEINVSKPLEQRAGIGFDLGGYYTLDTLKLYQGSASRPIYNMTVYAGNKMDESIFNNRVGVASSTDVCEQFKVALEGAEKVRYILVMFDHVAMHRNDTNAGYVHKYAYVTDIADIMLYGEESGAPDVAKIGDVGYASFEDALAAANDDDTLTLLADVNATQVVLIDKAITFDGNGYTLNTTASRGIRVTSGNTNVTIKNLTVVGAGVDVTERGIQIDVVDNTTLTLDNVKVSGAKYAINLGGGSGNTLNVVNGSDIMGYGAINVWGTAQTVVVAGSTLTTTDEGVPYGPTNAFAAVALNGSDATITITNSVVNAIANNNDMYAFLYAKDATTGNKITFDEATVLNAELPDDYKVVDGVFVAKADIDGDGEVTVDDLVDAKKMLLGALTKDDALDITGDGVFNILDFIALHKMIG